MMSERICERFCSTGEPSEDSCRPESAPQRLFCLRTHGWADSLASTDDILTIAILAVLSGGNGWEDMKSTESVNKRGYRHF